MALQNVIFSSYKPEDVKKFKTSNVLKKEVAELTKNLLNDPANTKEDNNAEKKEDIINDYGTMGYQYRTLSD